MQKKEYRVVCTQEMWTDRLFVDIALANGTTHDMIYNSRKQKNPQIEILGGSIYLTQIGNQEPQIKFTAHLGIPKNNCGYRYYMNLYKRLEPEIRRTFAMMQKLGIASTINVGNASALFDIYNMPKYASTPQEEKAIEEAARLRKIQENKKRTLARMQNDPDPLVVMKKRMQQYSGD